MTEPKRCPLCNVRLESGVINHLQRDHRRTYDDARALLERSVEGTLGWDPEVKKRKASFSHNVFRIPRSRHG